MKMKRINYGISRKIGTRIETRNGHLTVSADLVFEDDLFRIVKSHIQLAHPRWSLVGFAPCKEER